MLDKAYLFCNGIETNAYWNQGCNPGGSSGSPLVKFAEDVGGAAPFEFQVFRDISLFFFYFAHVFPTHIDILLQPW